MSPPLKPGDIVDVTLKGVEVTQSKNTEEGTEFTVLLDCDAGNWPRGIQIPAWPMVEVALRASGGWPPEAGDLWRDGRGELWFIYQNPVLDPEKPLLGRTANGARWTTVVEDLIHNNAPLTRVYREAVEDQLFGGGRR